jgi:serine protease Do
MKSILSSLSDDISSLVSSVLPSTVTISGNGLSLGSSSSGSGWIYDQSGHIVTNAHVVKDLVSPLKIKPAGKQQVDGEVIGVDQRTDLAVIRCASVTSLPPIKVRTSSPRLGEICIAVGSPLNLNESASLGIVSGLSRQSTHPDGHKIEEMIQTDASVNPGNSGGPLVDAEGLLIGVNTLGIGETVNFAVSSETVMRIVPELIQFGSIQRATIGVSISSTWLSADQGDKEAIQVRSVFEPSSPLMPGDYLLSIDSRPINRRIDIQNSLDRSAVGRELTVEVLRDKRTIALALTPRIAE